MKFALIGSHGTGKTTVFEQIRVTHPEFQYFQEGVRHQVPSFGFESPYDIIDRIGIGAFELMNLNSWSVIDPAVNSTLDPTRTIITDRSAIEGYAYFLSLKTERDNGVAELIRHMSRHYASLIDTFVYFPIGVFPLSGDQMRPCRPDFQREVDDKVRVALQELDVPMDKVYRLQSKDIEGRVNEILEVINH
ncbi:AAA family ATPase [Candidatus Woesearchaeota archaeon]|nr:AAA family ATPase [Candidatus Woesearchaeota archaeon]